MNLPSKLVSVLTMSTLAVALLGGLSSAGAEEMPQCIKDWVAQGRYTEFNGHQIFVHASGPEGMPADEAAREAALECQIAQIYANDGALVMSNIVRYLLERKEFYDRWVGTFTRFHSAPMTVLWGTDDPVAVEAMADRVKAWRPETDLYKLEGLGHWPSIEPPDVIAESIVHVG